MHTYGAIVYKCSFFNSILYLYFDVSDATPYSESHSPEDHNNRLSVPPEPTGADGNSTFLEHNNNGVPPELPTGTELWTYADTVHY